MIKKFFGILMMLFLVLVSLTNVYAEDGMFHVGAYTNIYRLSEQANIDLPFFNVFSKAATYDKDVTHSGISIGETTIDINEKLEGMHILFSTDMVTIKGEVEHSFIYANNVVIEGKLTGDSIIFAPTVQIKQGAIIERDVIIVANNLEIQGEVNGNVIATVTEKTNISGTIDSDLRIMTGDITLGDGAVKGDIYVETNSDTTLLKQEYPNAVIKTIQEETTNPTDWSRIITGGIVTVAVYTLFTLLLTRKENNIVERACKKFKANTVFGLIAAMVMLVLILVLPIVLIALVVFNLGIIAWPLLVTYAALLLLVATTAMLIVGMATYDSLKAKAGKYKIVVAPLIYAVLYTLTQITAVAAYANMAIYLIALAIVITMLVKKLPQNENSVEVKK